MLMASVELGARAVLNAPSYKIGNRHSNDSFLPKPAPCPGIHTRLGEALCDAHHNMVFLSAYSRVTLGKGYWVKRLSLFSMAKSFVFWYLGISRLAINLIFYYSKINRSDNPRLALIRMLHVPAGGRKLIKIGGR